MLSDAIDDFDDFVFDEATLGQIDEIENAAIPAIEQSTVEVGKKRPIGGARIQALNFVKPPPPRAVTTLPMGLQSRGSITGSGNGFQLRSVPPPLPPPPTHPIPQVNSHASSSTTRTLPSDHPIPRIQPRKTIQTKLNPQYRSPIPKPKPTTSNNRGLRSDQPIEIDLPVQPSSDDVYATWELGEEGLEEIDSVIHHKNVPVNVGTSGNVNRSNGGIGHSRTTPTKNSNSTSTTNHYQTHLNFRPAAGQRIRGKTWDRTRFASTGNRQKSLNNKDPGKGTKKKKKKRVVSFLSGEAVGSEEDDEEEEEELEEEVEGLFDQYPQPFIDPNKPPPEQKHFPLPSSAGTYIYPTNIPEREYQFQIVQSCLLDNTLVALPTGLGKTFIAGTVMLNFYRWFSQGKIVFLMPTKPLVTQQHEACQTTCGIPGADAATITGDDPDGWRDTAWASKRVFYATPQTFLIDMVKGRVDARDIVLIVIDEAHKASGNHSYVQCISYLQSVHPYFRIVALTATPGRTTEKVQEVVDKLHISRIEIREAESPEISKYMFKKHIEHHNIELDADFESLVNMVTQLMEPIYKMVSSASGTLRAFEDRRQLRYLRPFSVLQANNSMRGGGNMSLYGLGQNLYKLANALGHLMEYSLGMFYTILKDIMGNTKAKGKPGKNSLKENKIFKELVYHTEQMLDRGAVHPKFDKVLELLGNHIEAKRRAAARGGNGVTRCMVFCSFREGVNELVEMLNKHPLINAHKFVGRAQGNNISDKGLTQKQQKEVIEQFKSGKYNCLVATSIGEEGLDIGEVDFIVIYNCPKTSIKALQRIGRAGRKRDGFVHVLATVGREDKNWDAAIFNHRDIQSEIIIGKNLELYDDAPLMLPGMPDCNRMIMSVDPWVDEVKTRGSKRKSKASMEKTPKRQRGDPVPTGSGGFVRASALTVGGKKVGAGKKGRRDSLSSDDVSEDLPTLGDAVRPKDRVEDMTSDSEIEVPPRSSRLSARSAKSGSGRSLAKKTPVKSKRKDLSSGSDSETGDGHPPATKVPSLLSVIGVQSMKPKARTTKVIVDQDEDSTEENGYTGSSSSRTLDRPTREIEPYQTPPPPAPVQLPPTARTAGSEFSQLSGRWMLDLEDDEFKPEMPGAKILAKPFKAPTFVAGSVSSNMGPPASVPRSLTGAIRPMPTPQVEDSPLILRRRRRAIIPPSSDDREDSGVMPHTTAAAHDESSPAPAARVHKSKPRRTHKYVEDDLEVSGDDDGGTTEDTSGEESESDRRFAGHFQATQAPKGYNQRAAYLAGLSTQAPKGGPAFADRTAGHDLFMSKARRPILLSQEEPHPGPSSDYDGSFVCGDDTIDYDSGSDGLHE